MPCTNRDYPAEEYGMPLGASTAASAFMKAKAGFGKNCIGRSRAFLEPCNTPYLQSVFPAELNGVDLISTKASIASNLPSSERKRMNSLPFSCHGTLWTGKKTDHDELQTRIYGGMERVIQAITWACTYPDDRRGCLGCTLGTVLAISAPTLPAVYAAAQLYDRLVNSIPRLFNLGWIHRNDKVHDHWTTYLQFGRYPYRRKLFRNARGATQQRRYFIEGLCDPKKFSDIYGI